MNRQIALGLFAHARNGLLETVEGLTLAQVNLVPPGFNNNLAWQLGHVVAVDQKYVYEKGGLPMHIDDALLTPYGNGTKPERDLTQDEFDGLKKRAAETVELLKADLASNRFDTYTAHSMGPMNFNTVDDALALILFHEGLHLGAARLLRRAVLAQQSVTAAA